MGGELDDQLERAVEALADACKDDADWECAEKAASGAIQAAYEEYTSASSQWAST